MIFHAHSQKSLLLDSLSTYSTGVFDESATEIIAYDKASMKLFSTNGSSGDIDVIDVSKPADLKVADTIKIHSAGMGAGANSVAVCNGIVAAAIENDSTQLNGIVAFFSAQTGELIKTVEAGALPDMVTFSHDGTKVLCANEGEPSGSYNNDPEGSVTLIDISGGPANAVAHQILFTDWNSRRYELLNRGVRIADIAETAAKDLEPEYIALSDDDSKAFVTLQENNAVAIIDLANMTVADIIALGYKDHLRGTPMLEEYRIDKLENLPVLGTPVYKQGLPSVMLGGFSGLWHAKNESTETTDVFYAIPDRGPNADAINKSAVGTDQNIRPFKLPDYQARIVRFTVSDGTVHLDAEEQVFLTAKDGLTPISGKGNIPGIDEVPVTYTNESTDYPNKDFLDTANSVYYHQLAYDRFGGDFEGIAIDNKGNFWMCDEYRPAVYKFSPEGQLIERYVAKGTSKLGHTPKEEGFYGKETLPAVYAKRWANRGFEGIALDTAKQLVYAFIQSPMYNPSSKTKNKSDIIRILALNMENGQPVAEYVYSLEANKAMQHAIGRIDKIGDAVYIGNGRFIVIERDSSIPGSKGGKKYLFEINIAGATNILGTELSNATDDNALEMKTLDQLHELGVRAVHKHKILNLNTAGYLPSDKAEGIAYDAEKDIIYLMNDNDFGLAGAGVSDAISLGAISFKNNYGIDAVADSVPEIKNWPIYGMYQPDAIKSITIDGQTYFITANEGDDREYEYMGEEYADMQKLKNFALDSASFPNRDTLMTDAGLKSFRVDGTQGDIDGDGDFDYLYGFGTRSFAIWDEYGNLLYDSGNEFATIIAQKFPEAFNTTDDETEIDARSPKKGCEPEALEIAMINGSRYAFIGLEKMGGFMVYDITDIAHPQYVSYTNNRNFSLVTTDSIVNNLSVAGDNAPESILYIAADDSPNGKGLLFTANEMSGTITAYGSSNTFTLQLLHASDLEGGVEAIGRAANFAAIIDGLENRYPNTIKLSAGDNYIPGPFFSAASDGNFSKVLQEVYAQHHGKEASGELRSESGRTDISIMNIIGFDASAIGNHEFDAGTSMIASIIGAEYRADKTPPQLRWCGAQFPYLSSNLDFSADDNLAGLYTDSIRFSTDYATPLKDINEHTLGSKIAPATIIVRNGQKIGVVGGTTEALESISSTGGVKVKSTSSDKTDALALYIQPQIDKLTAMGINKIIVVTHLQQIALEKDLMSKLSGADIIIAGGSDVLMAKDGDKLHDGDQKAMDYPFETTNKDGEPALIVAQDGQYSYVGRLIVDFDEKGQLLSGSISEKSGAYATSKETVETIWGDSASAFVKGSKAELVKRLTSAVDEIVIEQDANIFGKSNVFLDGRRNTVRTQESNFGNLSADANLWYAQQSEPDVAVSLKNGGGIRAAIGEVKETQTGVYEYKAPLANPRSGKKEGEISQLDIANTMRFNNGLCILEVSPSELKMIIEHGVAGWAEGATPGQFCQIGGMQFSYDPEAVAQKLGKDASGTPIIETEGGRVQSMVIVDLEGNPLDVVLQNGEIIGDRSRKIKLVTLDFLANGGDNYPFALTASFNNKVCLKSDKKEGVADFAENGSEQDALAEYLHAKFSTEPFAEAETEINSDHRIENLSKRTDALIFNAPTLEKPLTDSTIAANEAIEYALNGVFADADNDELIISAASSNESVAKASVVEGKLLIQAVSQGEARIMLSASDGLMPIASDELLIAITEQVGTTDYKTAAIAVYPTICENELNILAESGATYHLVSAQGNIVKAGCLQTAAEHIDISALSKGTYYLMIEIGKFKVSKTVVRQ